MTAYHLLQYLKHLRKICVKCNQIVAYAKEAFNCGLCHRKTHITCADGRYSENEAVCLHCKPNLSKSENNNWVETEVKIKKLNAKHVEEIFISKRHEEKLISKKNKVNSMNNDLKRKLELTKNIDINQSGPSNL